MPPATAHATARPTAATDPLAPARRWPRELGVFLGLYLLYGVGRWVAVGDAGTALDNTAALVDLERSLGLFVEREVQGALAVGVPLWLANQVYLLSEFAVLPAVLVWLYRRHPLRYAQLRTTILVTWVIAIPLFALVPVAPPRLADLGIADTVSAGSVPLGSRLVTPFYNPYAAVPSLHSGFALALGAALVVVAGRRRPLLLAAGLVWPATVALSTIVTGNHSVLDAVAGFAVTVLGWAIAASGAPGRVASTARRAKAATRRGPAAHPPLAPC